MPQRCCLPLLPSCFSACLLASSACLPHLPACRWSNAGLGSRPDSPATEADLRLMGTSSRREVDFCLCLAPSSASVCLLCRQTSRQVTAAAAAERLAHICLDTATRVAWAAGAAGAAGLGCCCRVLYCAVLWAVDATCLVCGSCGVRPCPPLLGALFLCLSSVICVFIRSLLCQSSACYSVTLHSNGGAPSPPQCRLQVGASPK